MSVVDPEDALNKFRRSANVNEIVLVDDVTIFPEASIKFPDASVDVLVVTNDSRSCNWKRRTMTSKTSGPRTFHISIFTIYLGCFKFEHSCQ